MDHHVSVVGTDLGFACAEGDTLLRSALRAGLSPTYECNSGSCGSCRYELVEGEMRDLRPDAPGLTARDRRKGRRLACQSEPLSSCSVRIAVSEQPARHRPVRQTADLREINRLTHDMAEFVFATRRPAAFSPGQYAMITLPDGRTERAYSMSNIGNCHGNWRFVIKRTPGGSATSVLFDHLEVGATVVLDGPYGNAHLREDDDRKIACVGGGSGIGAMTSIVLGAAALPDAADRTVHLFVGGRTTDDIVLPESLELAGRRLGALHVRTAVSEQHDDAGDAFRGFVHEAVVADLGDDVTDFTCYAAGPPAMTDALARSLVIDRGLDAELLRFDRFC
ncbi:2Fe-2S iron-sulfur cluster binding domain-containing protein [Saccharopolyspora oryzae]|uniref:2Fe-2S iron-sulfur cluster binding domain-containing protein n=1 Tax=Saccharopolyspora oryzae TaxID=2997343 RepID=A0ABT4UUD8_9PSEU|nr:2Fe-2S iron-sulfur cluster binding domain-containing protein [Saccharopolyspora oryzae]MDA3624662.1 2Fe-2S iron-sulfur cluster binding domain-containing protein [Saccharopolyspora oryzae]